MKLKWYSEGIIILLISVFLLYYIFWGYKQQEKEHVTFLVERLHKVKQKIQKTRVLYIGVLFLYESMVSLKRGYSSFPELYM